MDKIIFNNGIDYLQWIDEDGNVWIAEYEAVKFFGKEYYESYPNAEESLSSWGVDFEPSNDENYISNCFTLINL